MRAFLPLAAAQGWTKGALRQAEAAAGLAPGAAAFLFPGGVRDLATFLSDWADARMLEALEADSSFARLRTRAKIAEAAKTRFRLLAPWREALRRRAGMAALPFHAIEALRRLHKTVDLIWRAAGDESTDFNYYTKRMLLAAVMKATTLYWYGDDKPGQKDTEAFLERRLADVMKLGKTISLVREFSPADLVRAVRRRLG